MGTKHDDEGLKKSLQNPFEGYLQENGRLLSTEYIKLFKQKAKAQLLRGLKIRRIYKRIDPKNPNFLPLHSFDFSRLLARPLPGYGVCRR